MLLPLRATVHCWPNGVGRQMRGRDMIRLLWLALGFASLGLALLGAALPLLPTTPFLLVSAFAFARSSPQFHDWLVEHPHLGPPIQDWRREGAISRKAKIAGVAAMAAAWGLSLLMGVSTTILLIQAFVLGAAGVFVVTRPEPT